ncbi:MAG: hypothetical protein N3A54_03315, partial [Patescibacteria group bacterium]|nr:hypothetical protein [Patescibacteria group bacterium]
HSHFGIPNADYYNFQEPLLYPISGVEDVQVGYSNATMIVLLSNGTVLCSGRNANGSCGQGHTNTVTAPQAVKINSGTELSNVKKIFLVSTTGFCALTTSDQLYCWGRNNKGQLCTNDYSDRYYATPITFYESGVPLQVKDVAGGGEFGSFSTAYYLLSNNKVVGCGDNTHGFLGTGAITPTQFATPQEILLPDDGIYSLSFAKDSACYIDSSKNVWCVGSEAGGKFASIEKLGYHVEPTSPILGNRYALKVKVIDDAMCFHTTTGNLYCAGNNKYGVGKHCSESLCNMNIEGTVTDFDINKKHGCVVSSGKVYCWGNNSNGQLGNGTFASSVVPQKINSNANFISVYTGVDHTCAITNVGALYCWGNNRYGQIGDGTNTDRSQPVLVDLGEKVVKMSLGETYSCAIAHPGSDSNLKSVFCWGTNFKEVNNGSTSGKYYPHIKIIPSSYNGFSYSNIALDIAGGDNHVCALLFNSGGGKNVKCWGKNEKLFQSSNFITEPKIMSSSSLVSKIATGNNVLCYLNENSIIIGCIGNTKEASLVY